VLAMAMVTVAMPSALVMMGRWRFGSARPWAGLDTETLADPTGLVETISGVLRGQFTDQMLVDVTVRAVLLSGWICVATIVSSVVIEVVHQLRDSEPRTQAARGLGWSQTIARSIAGGLLLILPVHGVSAAQSGSEEIVTVSAVAASMFAPSAHTGVSSSGFLKLSESASGIGGSGQYLVAAGETLWEIAERVLGNPLRWTEIWSLNQDLQMNDGRVFEDPHVILPGWVLQMPSAGILTPGISEQITAAESVPIPTDPMDGRWREMDHRRSGPFGPLEPLDAVEVDTGTLNTGTLNTGDLDADDLGVAQVVIMDALVVSPHFDSIASAEEPEWEISSPEDTGFENPVHLDDTASNDLLVRLGSATMLATGILAGLAAHRRRRLRASGAQVRPVPLDRLLMDQHLTTRGPRGTDDLDGDFFGRDDDLSEFADDPVTAGLEMAESSQRLLRLDLVLRIIAVPLIERDQAIAIVFMDDRGEIDILSTGDVVLERPFRGEGRRWVMPAQVGVDRLIEMAQGLDYPSPALIHLGNQPDGREIYVDLEVIGVLSVIDERHLNAPTERVSDVLRAMQVTLANSLFGYDLELYRIGSGRDEIQIPTDVLGSQAIGFCQGFDELADAVSGIATERLRVAMVDGALCLADAPEELWASGVVVIGRGEVPTSGAQLRARSGDWVLKGPVMENLELQLFPVGLSVTEAKELAELVEEQSEQPLLVYRADQHESVTLAVDPGHITAHSPDDGAPQRSDWALMVRLMGTVDVIDSRGRTARFDRSKSLELLAWCVTHRGRSTRSAARTAMWELNVRDATFANVVSEARRGTASLLPPAKDRDWLQRTLTEELVLNPGVTSDVEVMRATLDRVDQFGVTAVVTEVEAAVGLIRGMPCEASSYLWPEAEGISSDLILVATSLAASLALHRLAEGDVQGVFRATAAGLLALPGHEELIALRMRAHAAAGDLAGVKQEWAAYQRVMARDPWSSGEPAPKLRELSNELLGLGV
jgi:hypothetical protein